MTYYNDTDTCDRIKEDRQRCGKDFHGKAYKEYENKVWTRRWNCSSCYNKDRYHKGKDTTSLIKSMRPCRMGNQNISTNAEGNKVQELACRLYEWEDLNKKYDNYKYPLDCYDSKMESYHQVQGACYSSDGYWPFRGFKDEWEKMFKNMYCFCFSKKWKIIERIYIFPKEEILIRTGTSIVKNPSKGKIWYDQYRVRDEEILRKANEIWKDIMGE